MLKDVFKRTWVSPLVAVSFAAVAISGVLMLFHVRATALHAVHEWMGVVLAIAGAVHLAINWRAFVGCFRQRAAVVAAVVALLLCLALMLAGLAAGPDHEGRGPGRHGERAADVD